MANNGINPAASYAAALSRDQFRAASGSRPSGSRADEDVRRFACDRCRGQKLRCERNRMSLHTPLRSTPCRRCIRARVRCITSTQPRAGRSLDETSARSQHQQQQAARPRRAATFDVHLGDFIGSDDDEAEEAEAQVDAEMEESRDQQTQAHGEDGTRTATGRPIQSPTSLLPGMGGAHYTSSRTQDLTADGGTGSTVDPALLREPQSLHLHSKQTRPSSSTAVKAGPAPQLGHDYANGADHMASPGRDAEAHFFGELDSLMDTNFDGGEGVNWSESSLMDSLSRDADFAAGALDTNHDGVGSGASTLVENLPPTMADNTTQVPSPGARQLELVHVELTSKLTQLTSALLRDLHSDQDSASSAGGHQLGKAESQDSLMGRMLCNVERFLGILKEVSVGNHVPCPSAKGGFDAVMASLGAENAEFGRFRQASNTSTTESNKQAPATATSGPTPAASCGLPGLTTVMAIFAAYSCVLQAYEHVFGRIQRSLTRTDRAGAGVSLGLLPLFQLDSVKLAAQNSLQVHIAMEVSLQMLNQIENRLSFILSVYSSSSETSEETKACLLALLQSLTYTEGGDSLSVSAVIRGSVNRVRGLFIPDGDFS